MEDINGQTNFIAAAFLCFFVSFSIAFFAGNCFSVVNLLLKGPTFAVFAPKGQCTYITVASITPASARQTETKKQLHTRKRNNHNSNNSQNNATAATFTTPQQHYLHDSSNTKNTITTTKSPQRRSQ
jgi:hypothetical protein